MSLRLFKKQWGVNLSKFNGVTMLGGVHFKWSTNLFRSITRYRKTRN